jgi:uncharacterized protein (TIGR03118 family)
MNKSARFSLMATAILVSTLHAGTWRAEADTLVQTNLVSDLPGASITDASLVNPWGSSRLPTSPFWVSNQVTSTATLYAVTDTLSVTKNPLTVAIPTTGSGPPSGPPQGPTGQVANTGTSFVLGDGNPARFIFANLNGTISAWNPSLGTTAAIQVPSAGAVYTGLAMTQAPQPMLYAAKAGGIDVFDGSFKPVTTLPAGAFATPGAISALGLVPFNVQNLGGNLYVTYAPAALADQRNAAPGAGAIAVFDTSGNLLRTIVGGPLASPWGIAIAPANFGQFSGDLLVGNFSFMASEINAFNLMTGTLVGTIPINPGAGNTAGGLWFIGFGGGLNGGPSNALFFTDGIDGETHGLFGVITSEVPLPAALPLFATGLGAIGLLAWRRRQKVA